MSQNSLLTAADNLLLEIFLSRALHELDLSFFPLYHKYLEVSKKHSHMKWLCAILSRLLRCRPWDLRLHELTKFQEQTQQSLAMVLHFTLNKNRNPYDGLQGLHNLSPSMSPPHTHMSTHTSYDLLFLSNLLSFPLLALVTSPTHFSQILPQGHCTPCSSTWSSLPPRQPWGSLLPFP